MSSFSGLSAILTVSFVAILTVQILKDKFETIENYGEYDDDGNYINSYTTHDISTSKNVGEDIQNLPVHENLNSFPAHGNTPFKTGNFFSSPYVSPDSNEWSGVPEAYSVYIANINAMTPTAEQLNSISSTQNLPGPNLFTQDSFAQANVNTGRAANLTLCSQNMNTYGVGNSAIASSLLPSPNENLEGFSDCNVNSLTNQVFLTSQGQIGFDSSGSLRNSSKDLRSSPPNPIKAVSPWMNSTIYPDLTRRPLEGCGPSFGLYGNGPYSSGIPTTIKP